MSAPDSFKATCKRKDSFPAADQFWARVEELGGTVLEPAWLGSNKPHKVRCAAGHECAPWPDSVQRGRGVCRTCATELKTSEAAFRARVAELGGTVLEPAWLGNHKPHRVRCAAGHECAPHPSSVQQRRGLCRTCARLDTKVAEAAFRVRVAELGGTVLEPVWLGSRKPHKVRCADGHVSSPHPSSVQRGRGICGQCKGRDHRTYYIVSSDRLIKPGITTNDPQPRLIEHRRSYRLTDVHRVVTGLPEGFAREVERHVLEALAEQGVDPCFGHEYFRAEWLDLIIHTADEYMAGELIAVGAKARELRATAV